MIPPMLGNVFVSGKGKRKFLRIVMGAQTCSLIECGCTPRSYAKTNHLFKRGIFCQFQCHRADHAVTSANGTLAFHRWWHHLNTVFTINTQRSLWTKGNDNPFGLAAINDFLRGFADIVRLGEFAIHQRTEFFWLGLTNSMLPIASAALNASPELSTMQRIPLFCAAEISWVNFSSFTPAAGFRL